MKGMANLDGAPSGLSFLLPDLTTALEAVASAIGCGFPRASVLSVHDSMGLLNNSVLTPIL